MIAIVASIAAMAAIIALRYLAVSGAFAALRPALYAGRRAQIAREIAWSMAAAAIYAVPAGIVAWGWQAHGWTRLSTRLADHPLWWWPLSILLFLALHDAWFYWTHRWMHRPRPFRAIHAVHHAGRRPTPFSAMSFHPWEALTGAAVVPALCFVIPIHVLALAVVLTVMSLVAVTNHLGWEIFPSRLVAGPIGGWLITASHHDRHHRDYRCNYGLYFRWWDRLCGTDRGLDAIGGRSGNGHHA